MEATLAGSQHIKASLRQELSDIFEHVDSTTKSGLTFLAPLTYLLIIEELRPEDTPRGRFRFPHIADPVSAVGISPARASACPPCPK